MRTLPKAVCLIVFAMLVSSCGKSPTQVSDQLSQQEALALYSEISVAISQALANVSFSGAAARSPSAITQAYSGSMKSTAPCNAGGAIDVTGTYNGSIDTDAGTYSYDYQMTMVPNACKASGGASQFTIGGDPNLTISGAYHFDGTTYDYTYNQQGGVSFTTSDGRSGSCQISYTTTVAYDGVKSTAEVKGSICGIDMSVASSG